MELKDFIGPEGLTEQRIKNISSLFEAERMPKGKKIEALKLSARRFKNQRLENSQDFIDILLKNLYAEQVAYKHTSHIEVLFLINKSFKAIWNFGGKKFVQTFFECWYANAITGGIYRK